MNRFKTLAGTALRFVFKALCYGVLCVLFLGLAPLICLMGTSAEIGDLTASVDVDSLFKGPSQ